MSILDRYLFRLFMRSYFMFFFSMLGLYVMMGIFETLWRLPGKIRERRSMATVEVRAPSRPNE